MQERVRIRVPNVMEESDSVLVPMAMTTMGPSESLDRMVYWPAPDERATAFPATVQERGEPSPEIETEIVSLTCAVQYMYAHAHEKWVGCEYDTESNAPS